MPSPDHGDREHAPFAPSSAEIWMACPASVPLTEICRAAGQEDTTGPDALAGTIGHEVAEAALRRGEDAGVVVTPAQSRAWQDLGADPAEYLRAVQVYLDYVRSIIRTNPDATPYARGGADSLIETRVQVHGKEVWGSIDFAHAYSMDTLHVVDLKLGAGKFVSPEENKQLLTYSAGLLEKYPTCESVVLVIVQPRYTDADPVRSWITTPERVRRHLKEVKAAVKASRLTGAADRGVIGDHCRWCKGQAICKAKRAQSLSILDDHPEGSDAIASASPEALAQVLDKADAIRAFLDAVEAHCLRNPPPGYKLVAGSSRRSWMKDTESVAKRLRAAGVADPFRQSLITLGEAEKLLGGKERAEAILKICTVKAQAPPVLVPNGDKRPALSTARDVLDTPPTE